MKIIKLEDSQLKSKRFRVYLDNNKSYDFGLKSGETYTNHKDIYEQPYIQILIPSPALFSYYLLWGDSSNINQNIKTLNKLLK